MSHKFYERYLCRRRLIKIRKLYTDVFKGSQWRSSLFSSSSVCEVMQCRLPATICIHNATLSHPIQCNVRVSAYWFSYFMENGGKTVKCAFKKLNLAVVLLLTLCMLMRQYCITQPPSLSHVSVHTHTKHTCTHFLSISHSISLPLFLIGNVAVAVVVVGWGGESAGVEWSC